MTQIATVAAQDAGQAPAETPERWLRLVPWLILAAVIAAVIAVSMHWDQWEADDLVQATDDATIQADTTVLQAKVGSYVRTVMFADFQRVKAGQVLVQLDDREFRAAVALAEARLAKAEAMLSNHKYEIATQQSSIAQAQAAADSAGSRLALALADERRFEALASSGAVTDQEADSARANAAEIRSNRAGGIAAVNIQQNQLDLIRGQRDQLQAEVLAARAQLEAARTALSYTRIVAPSDGTVGQRLLQPGSLLSPGTTIANFVSNRAAFIVANYKETQMARIAPGQPVEIEVDAFPGATLQGRVSRVAPSSGNTFSPARNEGTTGNFTKVVQRIAVRIDLLPGQPLARRLRAGMSVTTRINTDG